MQKPTDSIPFTNEGERALLYHALNNQTAALQVVGALNEDDFYNGFHRGAYRAIRQIVEAGRFPDVLSVDEAMQANKDATEESAQHLFSLAASDYPVASLRQHIELVKEKSQKRRLLSACKLAISKCHDAAYAVSDIRGELTNSLLQGEESETDVKTILQAAQGTYREISEAIKAKREHKLPGIITGFPLLDSKTTGFKPGEVIVVAALSSMGKTAFALNIADHAQQQCNVLYFSLEMKAEALAMRLLSSKTGLSLQDLRSGRVDAKQIATLAEGLKHIGGGLYVSDRFGRSTTDIMATAQLLKQRHGLGLVVIDYLQLIKSDSRKELDTLALDTMTRNLKVMAGELDVPVIVLSQLSRQADGQDRKPRLSDLRGSGAIEQNADLVLLLHKESRAATEADLRIEKHRNGETGIIPLHWDGAHTRFTEVATSHEAVF